MNSARCRRECNKYDLWFSADGCSVLYITFIICNMYVYKKMKLFEKTQINILSFIITPVRCELYLYRVDRAWSR